MTVLPVQANERAKLVTTMEATLDIMYLDAYKDYTSAQRQDAVRAVVEDKYDLEVLIRRALARNWKLLTVVEQTQVRNLIDQLIVQSFVDGMAGKDRPILDCGALIEVTSKRIEVPVVISFPSGKTFNVLYRLGLLKTGWQIYDIVAEDVSLVSNYRQQFDDHFRKGNGAQLIEKLEKLLKQEELDVSTIIL
ncbi:MAG: ABC transporter substrate-binding protein [Opitutae bacterium]|nr:ABC transporter substrate-binding protein [Opitutae bacterium]MDG1300042.1 ABC transporter substrate-binding protein [Opitutae bacterium]